jgi:hypothetical protein
VFKLDYNGQPACLAQSPQLHKQMAVCGGFKRMFEVGPVFSVGDRRRDLSITTPASSRRRTNSRELEHDEHTNTVSFVPRT